MMMLEKKRKMKRRMKFSALIYFASMIYSSIKLKKVSDKAMEALDVYIEKNK